MMGFGLMGIGLLFPLVLIGFIIAYGVGWRPSAPYNSQEAPSKSRHSALDVLNERYARGEIDHEEYQEIRRNLES